MCSRRSVPRSPDTSVPAALSATCTCPPPCPNPGQPTAPRSDGLGPQKAGVGSATAAWTSTAWRKDTTRDMQGEKDGVGCTRQWGRCSNGPLHTVGPQLELVMGAGAVSRRGWGGNSTEAANRLKGGLSFPICEMRTLNRISKFPSGSETRCLIQRKFQNH